MRNTGTVWPQTEWVVHIPRGGMLTLKQIRRVIGEAAGSGESDSEDLMQLVGTVQQAWSSLSTEYLERLVRIGEMQRSARAESPDPSK